MDGVQEMSCANLWRWRRGFGHGWRCPLGDVLVHCKKVEDHQGISMHKADGTSTDDEKGEKVRNSLISNVAEKVAEKLDLDSQSGVHESTEMDKSELLVEKCKHQIKPKPQMEGKHHFTIPLNAKPFSMASLITEVHDGVERAGGSENIEEQTIDSEKSLSEVQILFPREETINQYALNMEQYNIAQQLGNKLTELACSQCLTGFFFFYLPLHKVLVDLNVDSDETSKLEAESLAASAKALAHENAQYMFRLWQKVKYKIFGYKAINKLLSKFKHMLHKGGAYEDAVHLEKLNILLGQSCKEYWEERLQVERVERLKQAKEHWETQCRAFMGI
ncbi:E3 ubiquitin-protein ligase [Sesbania bispinosa]|nr:E3 ubiquitin-protein ligase [Sesbania bispinosa]